MKLVLDESVDKIIEKKLESSEVNCVRPKKELPDKEVLLFAIKKEEPLLTRDQGDFVSLDADMEHFGIMIDKYMHLRDRKLVAKTMSGILEEGSKLLKNNILYISNFYGRF